MLFCNLKANVIADLSVGGCSGGERRCAASAISDDVGSECSLLVVVEGVGVAVRLLRGGELDAAAVRDAESFVSAVGGEDDVSGVPVV